MTDDGACPLPYIDFNKFCEYQSKLLLKETDLFFKHHNLRLRKYVLPVKLPEWAKSFADVLDRGQEYDPLTTIYRHKHFLKCRILHNYSYIETKWNRTNDVRNKNIPFDLRPLTTEILNQLDIINEDILDPEFSGLLVTLNTHTYTRPEWNHYGSSDSMNGFKGGNDSSDWFGVKAGLEGEGDQKQGKISKIIAGALVECLITNERCIKSIWLHPELTKHSSRVLLQSFLPRLMYEIFLLPSVVTEEGVSRYNKFTYCMHNDLDLFPRQCWLLFASNKKMSLPRHYEPSTFEEHPVQLEYGDCHTDEVGYLDEFKFGTREQDVGEEAKLEPGSKSESFENFENLESFEKSEKSEKSENAEHFDNFEKSEKTETRSAKPENENHAGQESKDNLTNGELGNSAESETQALNGKIEMELDGEVKMKEQFERREKGEEVNGSELVVMSSGEGMNSNAVAVKKERKGEYGNGVNGTVNGAKEGEAELVLDESESEMVNGKVKKSEEESFEKTESFHKVEKTEKTEKSEKMEKNEHKLKPDEVKVKEDEKKVKAEAAKRKHEETRSGSESPREGLGRRSKRLAGLMEMVRNGLRRSARVNEIKQDKVKLKGDGNRSPRSEKQEQKVKGDGGRSPRNENFNKNERTKAEDKVKTDVKLRGAPGRKPEKEVKEERGRERKSSARLGLNNSVKKLRELFGLVGSVTSTRDVACSCRREKLKKTVDDQAWLDRLVGCTENYMYLMLPKKAERARLGLLVREGWRDLVTSHQDHVLVNDINNILPEYARDKLVALKSSTVNYNADVDEWCRLKREDLIDVTSDTEVYMRLPDNCDQ